MQESVKPLPSESASPVTPQDPARRRRQRLKLLAVLAVCAAPVIASYLTYYVIKPDGRTNYGELVEPQRPAAGLSVTRPDGTAAGMEAFRGKWVLLTAAPGACDAACAHRLYVMRQVRLTTGKERDRIERVLLLTDQASPAATVLAEHEGLHVLRTDPAALQRALPESQTLAAPSVYVVDPLGNLMMRWPKNHDPGKVRRDVAKLLYLSGIG